MSSLSYFRNMLANAREFSSREQELLERVQCVQDDPYRQHLVAERDIGKMVLKEGLWSLLGTLWDARQAKKASEKANSIFSYLRNAASPQEYKKIKDRVEVLSKELGEKIGVPYKNGHYTLEGNAHDPEMRKKLKVVREYSNKILMFLEQMKKKYRRS